MFRKTLEISSQASLCVMVNVENSDGSNTAVSIGSKEILSLRRHKSVDEDR